MTLFLISGVYSFLSTLTAHRVGERRNHREFFSSFKGLKTLALFLTYIFVILGMMHSFSMKRGTEMIYATNLGVCKLSPMLPVFEGRMYYESQTNNFVIISNAPGVMYIEDLGSNQPPTCFQ